MYTDQPESKRGLRAILFPPLDKKTRIRLGAMALAAADFVINVLILAAYARIGTVGNEVPVKILFIAVALNLIFFLAIRTGVSKAFRDPAMTWVQVLAACCSNLIALIMAPQIAIMFIVNLFVCLSFGSLYFSRREFVAAWAVASLLLGATLLLIGGDAGIAQRNATEKFLFWFVLTLALGRFLAINAEISRLRARLHARNKALAGATSRLAELASRDELTGLWNRREFMRHLHTELRRAERTGATFWVAIIDADHFKQVNDRFGHQAGDHALQALADIFERSRRATDIVARYGGEEFMLLLIDPRPEAVPAALERLRTGVERYDWHAVANGLRMTVSIGAAGWQDGESLNHILHRADRALYEAKNAGRNRLSISMK